MAARWAAAAGAALSCFCESRRRVPASLLFIYTHAMYTTPGGGYPTCTPRFEILREIIESPLRRHCASLRVSRCDGVGKFQNEFMN